MVSPSHPAPSAFPESGDRRQARPVAGSLPAAVNAELTLELLELSTADLPTDVLQDRLRKLAIRLTGGTGAANIEFDEDRKPVLTGSRITGRIPDSASFRDWLRDRAPDVIQRGNLVLEQPASCEGSQAALVPILTAGCLPELFLLLLPGSADTRVTIIILQRLAGVLRTQLKSQLAGQSVWKLNTLAAIIELVSESQGAADRNQAASRIANELARHFHCPFVAVSSLRGDAFGPVQISGARTIDARSNTCHDFLQAMEESVLRETPGRWPAADDSGNHLLLAHRQLAMQLQCEAVFSQPLTALDGRITGCVILAGPRDVVHDARLQKFMAAAAPRLAETLKLVSRTEFPWPVRWIQTLIRIIQGRRGWVGLGVAAGLLAVLALPMPYRVRGYCSIAPSEKRFAVAPYDGTIARGYVRPGDVVQAGELLAEMDDRHLTIELSGVAAEHVKARRRQSIALAEQDIAKAQLHALEAEKHSADESLLRHRQENHQIRSPIQGVVLSGSIERAEAASVRQGQVLFEIGTLQESRIEVEIAAGEIAMVRVGHPVTIRIDGFEGRPIRGTLAGISPQAEIRNGRLVFIGQVRFSPEESVLLTPGLRGSARIDGDPHPLAWNLFRRPWEVLCSWLVW